MKSELQQILVCPRCQHHLENQNADQLFCPECGNKFRVVEGKPFFTNVPATIEPWEKIERGPDKGTVWRRSNWQYLNEKNQ